MKVKLKIILVFLLVLFTTNHVFGVIDLETTLTAPSIILIESKTGKILYERDANEKLFPASTTKIMTALLTLENCDLTETAVASKNAILSVPIGYSNANIQVGETLTIEQLLYCLLIPSANEAANILAEYISGSTDGFADLMNERAKQLGCENTNFVNANGIHNENHYTTAFDLSLMAKEAMKNDVFRKIVATTKYTLPITDKYAKADRVLSTTNELIKTNTNNRLDNYYYESAIGIKTGYTNQAKNTFVAGALKDNLELIAVVLNTTQTTNGLSVRYLDTKNLFNYGFDNYNYNIIVEKDDILKTIVVQKATSKSKNLNLISESDIYAVVPKSTATFSPTFELKVDIKAPVQKGDILGTVSYTIDNTTYKTNILAQTNVKKSYINTYLLYIFIILFILFILINIINGLKSRKKRKKYNIKSVKLY